MRSLQLVGGRFGRLIVLCRSQRRGKDTYWDCECDCGAIRIVAGSKLTSGHTKSCGCYSVDRARAAHTVHSCNIKGMVSREYHSWNGMKQRCFNQRNAKYPRYGARGITVCERWRNDFAAFLQDMGKCPPGYTIDRENNDGHYEPGNCRWATPRQQSSNTRRNIFINVNGAALTIAEAARQFGLNPSTVQRRMTLGWPESRLLEPVHK